MARFVPNEDGLNELERQIQARVSAAVARGEEAAAGSGPDATAEAVAKELRAVGVQPDIEALRAEYRKAAGL